MGFIRQDNETSRDPEMPYPLGIYFLNAGVLPNGSLEEKQLVLVKMSKKERFGFTSYLLH